MNQARACQPLLLQASKRPLIPTKEVWTSFSQREGRSLSSQALVRAAPPRPGYNTSQHSSLVHIQTTRSFTKMSCPDCFRGYLRTDKTPSGKETTIHGRKTYVASPPDGTSPKGIVIIISDAFGIDFVNNKILADQYARKGNFLVYLPDFMDGNSAPAWLIETLDGLMGGGSWVQAPYHLFWFLYVFAPWLIRHRFGASMPKVTEFFAQVRKNEGKDGLPIAASGFCWGGLHSIYLCHGAEAYGVDGKALVDAGFAAHPSNTSAPGDFKEVKVPISLAFGEKDGMISMKQVDEIEALLRQKPGLKFEAKKYLGAGHGFGVRAELGNPKAAEQAEQSEDQAVKFFTEVFEKLKK